ncbi:amidohydrolase family protein [Gordonia soli]|uniref:Putative decarboxylase n=1 Tax=Gordonia soli NBRC 108243 TaxID=1223545 RepID=M0QKG6_9ACTN|nr:amidohydrolase family protein [Gordonia soli]GAC69053.1 putative decarboxylase [Gordonia soli NBRC 108243]
MGLIAIEEHWNHPALTDAVRALPLDVGDPSIVLDEMGDNLERLDDIDARRIDYMDAQGVEMQILSLAPPGAHPLPRESAVRLSAMANDLAAESVRRHPTRFRALACLPTADPAAAVAELERTVAQGFVGAMVYGRTRGIPFDDRGFDDLCAAAAHLRAPIFIHPQIPPAVVRTASYSGFDEVTDLGLATFGWGWHLEAAQAALRLIVAGTFDRHPDLQVILGHWGELLLFWRSRIAGLSRVAGLERPMDDYLRSNIHVTCSGMLDPVLLRHVLDVTTPDRLMFSTDYPFQRPTRDDIAGFLACFDDPAARELFVEGNARRLFGISVPPASD